jgi:tight adherence protein B
VGKQREAIMAQLVWVGLGSAAIGAALACGAAVASDLLDRVNGRYLRDLRGRMDALGMDVGELPLILRAWRGAVLGCFLLVWLGLGMFPLAILAAFLLHRLIPLGLDWRVEVRRRRIGEQVADAGRRLAGQVRAGMALEESLADLSREMPDPFGWHLRRAVNQLEQGQSVRAVLTDLKTRLQLEGVTLFTMAVLTAAERGGKLADVLERTASSLEELQRVHRKRESDTASGRLMVIILAAFPVVFLGLFALLDPTSTGAVFASFGGQAFLGVIGLMVYASVRWAQRILARVG